MKLMKTIRTCLPSILVFFLGVSSFAQMYPRYNSYDNLTATTDGNGNVASVTLTMTLDGYNEIDVSPRC